jgi:hypothetical protein
MFLVYTDGRVCVSILHSSTGTGTEDFNDHEPPEFK